MKDRLINNLANILTLARLAILPFIVLLLFCPEKWVWAAWIAFSLYVVGALTDFLDGWVARKFNQITEFGKFLDPIADKIYVVTILVMLVEAGRLAPLGVLAVIIILIREFTVAGLREFLGPKNIKLPVTKLAKWKTATQMTATGLLIAAPGLPFYLDIIGVLCLLAAAALTVITGWGYLKTAFEHMKE